MPLSLFQCGLDYLYAWSITNSVNSWCVWCAPWLNFLIGYGMTELSPMTHMIPVSKTSERKHGSCGVVLPNTKCKVCTIELFGHFLHHELYFSDC